MHRLLIALRSSLQSKHFKQAHCQIITYCPSLAPFFCKRLLESSMVAYARQVFDQIRQPDPGLYASLIFAYNKVLLNEEAVAVFILMHRSGTRIINSNVVPAVVKSCSSLLLLELGKAVHGLAVHYGFGLDVYVQTAFMDLYANAGNLVSAERIFYSILFKDPSCYNCLISGFSRTGNVQAALCLFNEMTERSIISWNSIIACCVNNGHNDKALQLFERMLVENFCPNEKTLVTMLSASAKLQDLNLGLKLRKLVYAYRICGNMIVQTAMLEMFVKCGAVNEAREEFDSMTKKDIVAWSAMISGYAQNGHATEALELFELMINEQIKPNGVALVSVLSACSQLGSLEAGDRISSYIESHNLISDIHIASALLDMYSKFGNVEKARQIFDKMLQKDVVSWNSMIAGLATNGFANEAIMLYEKMKEAEIKPDNLTFMGLLTACNHAGLVELGLNYFGNMKSFEGITLDVRHYACIVDLLCRTGRLKDAYEFVCQMELNPNAVIWGTLLSAARTHLNVELAELCITKLLEHDPGNSGNYVVLSNVYSTLGRWKEASSVRNLIRSKGLRKDAAYSWIEIDSVVHAFLVDDTSHPGSDELYTIIDGLQMQNTWSLCEVDSI